MDRRETPARRACFTAFWQDSAQDNPIEIARVSAALLFTQHYSNYVEYFSKCLHYKYTYPPFSPGVCRADPHPLSRPRAAASYCSEKFLALPTHFRLGGVIPHTIPKIFPYCEKPFYNNDITL
jgi:hypothetical protein